MSEQVNDDIKKIDGAIRMFRLWRVRQTPNGPRLTAFTTEHEWVPGVNTSHQVPTINQHGTGFYGFNQYNHMRLQEGFGAKSNSELIGGSFLGFGRVVVADDGARVQHSIIESIIEPPNMDINYVTTLFELAEHYKCRNISEDRAKQLKTGKIAFRVGMEL